MLVAISLSFPAWPDRDTLSNTATAARTFSGARCA